MLCHWVFVLINPGGLDSRDQLRSRSRTSFTSRLTFENRRECPSCWDQLFFSQSRFLSRLSRRVETRWDRLDRQISTWKVSTAWEISTRKYKNQRTSRSRLRQTIEKRRNFQISTNFSISIETFWSGHWCRDEIEKSRSRPRFLDCRDSLFDNVETNRDHVETNRDHVETNQDPQVLMLYLKQLRNFVKANRWIWNPTAMNVIGRNLCR